MDFLFVRDILVAEARALGLDDYEIFFSGTQQMSTETLKDEVSSFSSGACAGVSFRCVLGGRMGNAATELFEESELKGIVRRAMDNASVIENDDPVMIFGGSKFYEKAKSPAFAMPSAADVKALALDLQAKTYAESELITDGTQSGAFAEKTEIKLVNSKGLELSSTVAYGGSYVQAVVKDADDAVEAFDVALGYENAASIPASATKMALSKLGAAEVKSGKYSIIIDGKQMRALLSAYCSVFSGKQALLGLSLLSGKVGEAVAADCVTLVDDAMYEGGYVKTAFDGEGVATYKKNVIEKGVLNTLLYDLSTAAKAGVTTTANGQRTSYAQQVSIAPFTFYIEGGELSEEQLTQRMGDGLYVTEFNGLHAGANAVTGDFSIQSAGFLVENGKKTRAVKGFTVAGNFFSLLKDIKALSNEVKFGLPSGFTVFGSPDVLLEDVSVAGV